MLDYQENKATYLKELDKENYFYYYNKLNSWVDTESNKKIPESEYAVALSKKSDLKLADWADELIEKYSFKDKKAKDIRELLQEAIEKANEFLNVQDISIPVITYTGDYSNVAEVFENLNKGGTQLTKFEIFSAAWHNTTIKLENTPFQQEILLEVKNYYIKKQNDAQEFDFDLKGFSEDELTRTREINLFELGVALGKFIQRRLPALCVKENSSLELGFGLLGIIANVDPKKLVNLGGELNKIKSTLETSLIKIDHISIKLQQIFEFLKQNCRKGNKGSLYQTGLSTTYKTLSYFAALWNFEPESSNYRITLNNIPQYYISDALNRFWGNAGDNRLYEYYPKINKKNYLTSLNKENFKDTFNNWLLEVNTQPTDFNSSVRALATIHANLTYLSSYLKYGEALQFEHIYPKARIREKDLNKEVLLGRLGNAMFLPKLLNEKKKTKTLYEINDSDRYDDVIKESSYPSEDEFLYAFSELDKGNYDAVNDLIMKRSKKVIDELTERIFKSPF